MPQTPATGATQAHFVFDSEELHGLAGESQLRRAWRHAQDKRVVQVQFADGELHAEVEDEDSEEQLALSLGYDADGNLWSACDCANHGDGADTDGGLCVHALAALLAFGTAEPPDAKLGDAVAAAIDERVKRGRAEVRVEPVGGNHDDAPWFGTWFGTWRARSIGTGASPIQTTWQVQIRSLTERANHCTCPDFATNQLGTCKHIEAVLHRIGKRKDYKAIRNQPAPRPYVYLDWQRDDAPRIRLHRAAEMAAHLLPVLEDWFDADGAFRGRLPDEFLAFAEQHGGDELLIGDDALAYARRLADDAARELRARDIGSRIHDSGGRLPEIRARLYPYQVDGVAFLAGRGRALLADDMGLGKTLQAIAAAYWLHRNDNVERVLIVCPASLRFQWAREIERFTGAKAHQVQGPAEARAVQYRKGSGFYVINYELVLRDLSVINETLAPDLLILDEAQRIKNWRTKIATAIKRIPSRYAFVLSGTPLENRLEDLYSLMQVVDPRVLGPLWRYLVDFHITDERGKVLGYRNLSELRRRMQPVMLRRDRALVRDQLPDRIEQRRDVPLSPKQAEIHDEAINTAARLAQILKRRPLTPSEQNRMMAALQRARMACNAAGLVDKETKGSPKLDELASILEEGCQLAGLKAVVFSQWAQMGEMVEELVRRMGLGCVRLHGGVPSARRGALMDRFHDDDACQVFISTDAGGTGLNLQCASLLVNLDIPWNPAVLDQRVARVHRLGQRNKVQVVHLVAADAYEDHVLGLVQGKRDLFDNVVDTDATEDVVGMSKRLAEVLAEDLAGAAEPTQLPPAVAAEAAAELAPTEPEAAGMPAGTEAATAPADTAVAGTGLGDEVRRCIEVLQHELGPRIDRILGARGGLLVVLDQVDDADDARAAVISEQVPIALIDRRTLRGLQRLGAASPAADAEALYQAPTEPPAAAPSEPPLLRRARQKLEAAEVLLRQNCPAPAAELLLGALLNAAALCCGQDQPPEPHKAAVWLYAEALPGGRLQSDDATLIMRAQSLAQASDDIPPELLAALAADVATFVSGSDIGT
ncbi:MAG: DEAD/DEAH box helicase [Thiohalocapsa sp.]|jgi:superfamily II DNA or RNA helicase|uniref:DEAD/DEAH box helicase n=1 Tax=Thiohalocapsa sp. TaxID=2497641 RepID=UPI0025F027A9|nr:DEAD/DEAH box helicase [Thiohalocapsa sp.]MCG6941770.1 DEAD/DEAH box helicase [Thiohalocapsa sp.]